MKGVTNANQEQIDFYNENGYLGVENVLSEAEVADLQRTTDEFVEKSREVTEHTDVFDLEPGHTLENPRVRRIKSPSCTILSMSRPSAMTVFSTSLSS